MGLAASQCRLLFITARQNDVSAKMQRVSHDTLRLANDSEDVSNTYNNMLSNTKVKQLRDGVDLSYDTLMGQSAIENVGQVNLITNQNNQVVLSAGDASRYGLEAATGTGKDFTDIYKDVNAFIEKVDPTNAAAIKAAVSTSTASAAMNTTTAELTDANKKTLDLFKNTYGEFPDTTTMMSLSDNLYNYDFKGNLQKNGSDAYLNGNLGNASMADIINGNFTNVYIATQGDTDGVPKSQALANIKAIATTFKDALVSSLGIKTDSTTYKKLEDYVSQIYKRVDNWGAKTDVRNTEVTSKRECTGGCDTKDEMTANLKNILSAMAKEALNNGFADEKINDPLADKDKIFTVTINSKGWTKPEYESKLKQQTGSMNYNKAVEYVTAKSSSTKTGNGVNGTATVSQKAAAYQTLYNALASKGWSVEDTSSMGAKLDNGTYQLNGTSIRNNEDLYEEVDDTSLKDKAEVYWKTENAKIQRKEKMLDQEMQKYQTEYSALTNDLESVKSILNANVQRSFSYCQNG